jgi:hypothetical protein
VVEKFPKEWVMRYNLACYACQLGDLKAAWKSLEKAIDMAPSKDVKTMALEDKDLEPLWTDIGQI